MVYYTCQNQTTSNCVPSDNIYRKVKTKISTVHLKQNQGKTLYCEMRMPRKLFFKCHTLAIAFIRLIQIQARAIFKTPIV